MVMREELARPPQPGAGTDPDELQARGSEIEKVFNEYEQAKRDLSVAATCGWSSPSPRSTATAGCPSWTSSRRATPA